VPSTPPLWACPNCGLTQHDLRIYSSVEVARCRRCGQVMCAACCKTSFWSGYICPKCGSKGTERIGRIKDPMGLPTLSEEIIDGEAHKSELSPGCLRSLVVVGILAGWLIGLPLRFNVIATIAGIVVFLAADKISKRGSG
jgi:hypothetical protein